MLHKSNYARIEIKVKGKLDVDFKNRKQRNWSKIKYGDRKAHPLRWKSQEEREFLSVRRIGTERRRHRIPDAQVTNGHGISTDMPANPKKDNYPLSTYSGKQINISFNMTNDIR